jgi:hypothetical protein
MKRGIKYLGIAILAIFLLVVFANIPRLEISSGPSRSGIARLNVVFLNALLSQPDRDGQQITVLENAVVVRMLKGANPQKAIYLSDRLLKVSIGARSRNTTSLEFTIALSPWCLRVFV